MNELAYATLGAAIVATFTWPEVVVAVIVGVAMFLVVGCIAVAAWEGWWQWRNDREDARLAEEYDRERDYHLPPNERRWSA